MTPSRTASIPFRSLVGAVGLLGCLSAFAAAPAGAVIAGKVASERATPWIADLGTCGGTLVAPDRVLTAAHCVKAYADQPPRFWGKVAVGARRTADHSTRYGFFEVSGKQKAAAAHRLAVPVARRAAASVPGLEVAAVAVHPRYRELGNAAAYDVAVLRLAHPVTARPLPPAAPGDGSDAAGAPVTVFGRGQISHSGLGALGGKTDPRRTLRSGAIALIRDTTCTRLYAPTPDDFDPSNMICARDPRKKPLAKAGARYTTACYGDSGGPLAGRTRVKKPVLVGIVSWGGGRKGDSCGQRDNYPGVYARVAKLRDFALAADPGWQPRPTAAPAVQGVVAANQRVTCGGATFDRPAVVRETSWMIAGRLVKATTGDLLIPADAVGKPIACAVRAKGDTGTGTSDGSAPVVVAAAP